ncbi:MAG: extracellular solute-binding protein [Anaerolineae bacterium]|nr:extracellular solute-binding protein [Anaerolineae bacterium]
MVRLRNIVHSLLLAVLLAGCLPVQQFIEDWTGKTSSEMQIVVLWHNFTGTEEMAIRALSDRFNRENTAGVVLIPEYQHHIREKLSQTSPAHQPDLLVIWSEELDDYRYEKRIASFGFLPLEVRQQQGDMLPMAEALFSINGNLSALPLGVETYILYYNSDWLGDLGYDTTSATLETVRSISCSATNPTGGQMGLGIPLHESALLAFLTAGGSELFGADGQYHFADAGGIDTVSALNAMLSGSCALVYEDLDVGVERLSNSSMAMLVESSLRLSEIEQSVTGGRNFSLGAGAIPGLVGPGQTLWNGPGVLCISPSGPRREAAMHVLSWFYTPEAQQIWSEATNYLPVRTSLLKARVETESGALMTILAQLALDAAQKQMWVAWPRHISAQSCRSALRQTLFSLGSETLMPSVYVEQATAACNSGIIAIQP